MGPSPKKIDEYKEQTSTIKPAAAIPPAKKVSNCFSLGTPPGPGLVPVSTDKLNKNGCLILAWQPQQVTMLVSDAPLWYSYAGKILKANLVFAFVFALCFIVVLVVQRDRW